MVQIDATTLFVHNGHDNDNEKIEDAWIFDLSKKEWNMLETTGDVPSGRTGHSLMKFKNYIIQFGGILEITKESDEIYVYNIPTKEWKLIDCTLGPLNLEAAFQQVVELDMNPNLSTHLKMNHSSPNIHHGG